jgi:prepilin-type N-terminal cleavage/methylation domain-containing protein
MARDAFNSSSRGFSLIEVTVSLGLLTVVALSVAQLFAVSTRANLVAKGRTSATTLAEQKMEQLRSLTWGFDSEGLGLPVSDTTTNLSVFPPTQDGPGLNPSPSDTLEANVQGYFEYLDANGSWVGSADNATYIRRWAIRPLPTNPNNTLVLQVLVTPLADERVREATSPDGPRPRLPGDALLTSVKTRKAS